MIPQPKQTIKIYLDMKSVKFTLLLTLAAACSLTTVVGAKPQKGQKSEVKNVIFMIGDGMGLSQATMMMVESGYEPTVFERVDNVALIKTHSANNRVTDSAAAGTALACGEKTNNKMLGLTPKLDTLHSMAKGAKAKGMSTGIVVACAVQHATPAAFYANVADRNDNKTITEQLAKNDYIDIIIGGGETHFNKPAEGGTTMSKVAQSNGFNIVRNMDEFEAAGDGRILGLFTTGHIANFNKRGDYLPRATAEALKRLSTNKNGFFLMVEGSQIDWACHSNDAKQCKGETIDFCKTIEVAMDFADKNAGTLIVITADHETGGLALVSGDDDFTKADSGVSYTFSTKGHSGVMIPVYTYGAGAEQINGVMDNTELAHKMFKSMGIER